MNVVISKKGGVLFLDEYFRSVQKSSDEGETETDAEIRYRNGKDPVSETVHILSEKRWTA